MHSNHSQISAKKGKRTKKKAWRLATPDTQWGPKRSSIQAFDTVQLDLARHLFLFDFDLGEKEQKT
jgi:hypothetical protein